MGERRGTKALELWCRRMTDGYPGVKIDNMTTSWRDGLAFCAMIHHFRPDLIEFEKLNKSDIYYNNDLAFRTAEIHLGIPALLDADDMAAYEVPDRLSILTYLSQFYQVFAAQGKLIYQATHSNTLATMDSTNRLKRSSATTEKSQITKTQGPPAKMAHVVGVPKRDPCQKCNLPVFLAERLTVGKKVYHRTCLKCARCSSQLTPGSFYETEVDGEYCCETCPDEETSLEVETEVILRNAPPTAAAAETYISEIPAVRPKTTVRSSIADRLAFFEKSKENDPPTASSSTKLLQKSLSDEEKTKSLKKMSIGSVETSPSYKMNPALSSFMSSTLDEIDGGAGDEKGDTIAQMDTSESLATSSDEDEEGEENEEDEKKPPLPTTLPPPQPIESKTSTLEKETEKKVKPFTSTAQITLRTAEIIKTDNSNTPPADDSKLENLNNNNDDDDDAQVEETPSTTSITTADDLNLSKSKSNFVTKDNTEPNEQMRTTNATKTVESSTVTMPSSSSTSPSPSPEANTAAGPAEEIVVKVDQPIDEQQEVEKTPLPPLRQRPITLDIKTNCNSDMTSTTMAMAGHEDEETTNRLSVVRARLHQFEVIANNTNDNHKTPETSSSVNSSSIKSENSDSIKPTAAAVAPIHQDEEQMETVTSVETIPSVEILLPEEAMKVASTVETTSSSVEAKADLEMESDKVPKHEETQVEIETKTATVSIEEDITPKTVDDPTPMPPVIPTITETPAETVLGPKKLIPVDIQIDEESTVGEANKSEKESPIKAEKPQIKKKEELLPYTSPAKVNLELYPEELNPFKSDDEDEDDVAPLPTPVKPVTPATRRSLTSGVGTPSPAPSGSSTAKKEDKDRSLNPFDSSDDEVEMDKKVKPPRPPPPKISKNPFGSESEDGGDENSSSLSNVKRVPIPAPRTNVSLSQNPTPEPTPRLSQKQPNHYISPLNNSGDFYGSNSSLGSTPYSLQRNIDGRGSNHSLTSSTGTIRSRKSRKAPAPPPPVKELFPSTETLDSKKSSPCSSNSATPNQGRKKRPAPAPPKPARLLDPVVVLSAKIENNNDTDSKNSLSYPLQSDLDKLSDEEKALLEGNRLERTSEQHQEADHYPDSISSVRKLIPLDFSLVSDGDDVIKQKEEDNVVYRRTIVAPNIASPTHDDPIISDRQLEKMKDNKEAQNRNRQSQVSSGAEDSDPLYNKSSHGKWKRRKGPAPALPIPPRKVLQMLPLQEIRHELDIIEVQQQGLEKQGVILEKMIRDRCEGKNGELDTPEGGNASTAGHPQNSKEVEDLILQLFELVNEKNELFRRQAELMYLRRQHRLEQEQADLEYEIRVLMAQPERNKTDTDKAREEALIARMVEVVQLRNEVVECLEMDRLREAEEDLSIKQRLELHSANREQEMNRNTLSKLSKKEKKKQKEAKKFGKSKKLDADKDADESELSLEKEKSKKKKKKFLF